MTLVSVSINPYTFLQTFASLSAYFWKYFLSWLPYQCVHLPPNPLPQGLFVLWLSCCTSGSSGFPGGGSNSNESARNARDLDSIPGLGRSLEEGMAAHSSILAWWVPWTEEPGGLQLMGSLSWTQWQTLRRGREVEWGGLLSNTNLWLHSSILLVVLNPLWFHFRFWALPCI